MGEASLLRDLLIVFTLGVLVIVAFHRIGVPPIIGFMITGAVCGPFGLGLVNDVEAVQALSEIGVILLLFSIGLQFSISQLVKLRRTVLVGGGIQVFGTMAAVATLAAFVGMDWRAAVLLGMLVAHSSSTLIMRYLGDRGESDSLHARSALGVSLFQDLSVVPMVLALPLLAGEHDGFTETILVVVRAVAFMAAAIFMARVVAPYVLERVIRTRQREAFILTVVLLCFGTAWAAAAAGLSLALGAFIAGLIISESEYSHQALGDILPLREVFISLFFISIGMLLDARTLLTMPVAVALALTAVVALKFSISAGALLVVGHTSRTAILGGAALAQIGEFGFVLLAAAAVSGLIQPQTSQLFLPVAIGSMALMPLLFAIAPRLVPRLSLNAPDREVSGTTGIYGAQPAGDHVIIIGYGVNGRNLARVLGRNAIPFIIAETNPEIVRAERARGRPIIYGDATRPEVLHLAGIASARVLVVAVSDAAASRGIVSRARLLNPDVHIVVRTRYVGEMQPLLALGTNEVIAEEFETSMEIFARVLLRYLVPRETIDAAVDQIRVDGYEMFRGLGNGSTTRTDLGRYLSNVSIEARLIEEGAELAGVAIGEAQIRERHGTSIVALQRTDGELLVNPSGDVVLRPGDTVLLLGKRDELCAATGLFRAVSE